MFCYQCQETLSNEGCNKSGVCGKTETTANLQDLLIYMLKGVSFCVERTRPTGISTMKADEFVCDSLFLTLTNTCFDNAVLENAIMEAAEIRENLKKAAKASKGDTSPCACSLPDAASYIPQSKSELAAKALETSILAEPNEDIRSLRELLVYGIKGVAAYACHAAELGEHDDEFYKYMHRALAYTITPNQDAGKLQELALECGKHAVSVMALLDKVHTERFGKQEPTNVPLSLKAGKAILVSGHDMADLYELLEQTEGKGINIYTHGEMLTAHAYPALKKFKHLAGHFGSSWVHQQTELEKFSGAILFTTNCIQKPRDSYKGRVFTTGAAGWADIPHIANRAKGGKKDFSSLITNAMKTEPLTETKDGTLTIGFAKDTVMSVADKVIDAVKSGAITKFAVMAGCDGRHKDRSYFTEVAEQLPKTAVILTAGCAKYRYNRLELGDIGGIPRLLDAGQCNDCYSIAYIALKLKDAFGLDDINKLPVEFYVAWYEQKAVAVLLALLHLGFKDVRIGTTLPAFLSPNVANTLVNAFGLKKTSTPAQDLANI